MVFPRKTLQQSSCEPRLSWSLEKNEGDLACFNHSRVFASSSSQSNFLRLCFRASWARRYGWCRVFARPFNFLCIERLHQVVVGFPWEKRPSTLADKLRTETKRFRNEIKDETFWGRFLWNLVASRAVSAFKLIITLQICQTSQQVFQWISSSRYDGKLQVVQLFASLLPQILLILVRELIIWCISRNWILLNQLSWEASVSLAASD